MTYLDIMNSVLRRHRLGSAALHRAGQTLTHRIGGAAPADYPQEVAA